MHNNWQCTFSGEVPLGGWEMGWGCSMGAPLAGWGTKRSPQPTLALPPAAIAVGCAWIDSTNTAIQLLHHSYTTLYMENLGVVLSTLICRRWPIHVLEWTNVILCVNWFETKIVSRTQPTLSQEAIFFETLTNNKLVICIIQSKLHSVNHWLGG